MKPDPKLSKVIGTADAAAICGLTPEAIMAAVARGDLPAKRLGARAIALHLREVERYRDSERDKGGRPKLS